MRRAEVKMEDEKELRDYMQNEFRGLRSDRSTCSYALEFLRTSQSNLRMAHERIAITLAIDGLKRSLEYFDGHRSWLDEAMSKLKKLSPTEL